MLRGLKHIMQAKVSIKLLIILEKYKFAALESMVNFMCQLEWAKGTTDSW